MTDKERQLIIDSITHWQKDAVDKFEEGYLDLYEIHSLNSAECPLCQNYSCGDCLWFKHSNKLCCDHKQEYDLFTSNSTKENALKVIEKLWRIGKNI